MAWRMQLTVKTRHVPICMLTILISSAGGQLSSTQPPIKGMASTVGLYVYPRKQQSATQQLTDESQCYENAKTQTGFDPDSAAPAAQPQSQNGKDHGTAKGAAQGAMIAGATGGDAARGAILGGARSRRREKQESEQTEKQADANKTQQQQKQDNFKRALSACLDARGYSVK